MFSSKTQLIKRTPENGTDRESYLSQLVDEYLQSSSYDVKRQVLANLGNFAYDPINYQYIRDVGVLDIFLYVLKNEHDHQLVHFAVAGVCNLCIDPQNAEYIIAHCGLKPIAALLKLNNSDILTDTLTSLIQLKDYYTGSDIDNKETFEVACEIQKSEDKRLSNLATIFLQDVCSTNKK